MTQEITAEQAPHIHDLESYKNVLKVKRFKRTKEEMDLGLSPEEALDRRLAAFGNPLQEAPIETVDPRPRPRRRSGGEIIVKIRPDRNVDADYFEDLPSGTLEVTLDNHWYSWLATRAQQPYENDHQKLLTHILALGIGEVLTKIQFEKDLKEYDDAIHPVGR
jgi:hypothetical protein